MKEQSYRKGNKKVILYCVVELIHPINRIKYSEPTKRYIFEQNIWLKPDFYATQIVSCPGLITLVHPKLTNKVELTDTLIRMLGEVPTDTEEDVVKEWKQHRGIDLKHKGFQLETQYPPKYCT